MDGPVHGRAGASRDGGSRRRLVPLVKQQKDPRSERLDAAAGLLEEPLHPSPLPSVEHQLPPLLGQQLRELAPGDFLERAVNVLAFGLPGFGKSHAASAIGHALVDAGHSVLFIPTYQLVQELLAVCAACGERAAPSGTPGCRR